MTAATVAGSPSPSAARTDKTPLHATIQSLINADRLLLCSDGLGDLVDLDIIEELLNWAGSPPPAVKSRWAVAMNASGVDNVTIVLIEPGQVSI